jgi:anti-anti-sigma regulatory factor
VKITEEYIQYNVDYIDIKSVRYVGDFVIRIFFSDGVSKLVDFRPFLESSLHPSIRKYLDESKFKEYQIIDGNLNWNDYDMIFPIEDLYQGRV